MKILTSFLILVFLCLFFSCKQDTASVNLLRQAQNIAESSPYDALILLDSIHNPENMDKDNYMQYIVASVQAKQRAKQDITKDTLIFDAKRYFEKKNNSEQSALAHYYAGRIYRTQNIPDKALKCFLQATTYANQSGNNTLAGKSLQIMGNLYFEQGIVDTAIVFYKKALDYYNKEEETDIYKLQVITSIGISYDEIKNIDSSYIYFKKGLEEANRLGNNEFKADLSNNLGYTYFLKKDYDKALYYLNRSLLQTSDVKTSTKAYLTLSFLYNSKNQLDSAKYYINLSEKQLAEITDNQTLKYFYTNFFNYFKKAGDYKQALHYKEQEDSIKVLIAKNQRPLSLLDADKNFFLAQKDKEFDQIRVKNYLFLGIGAILIVAIFILVGVLLFRSNKKDKEEIKLQEAKFRNIKDQLIAMESRYKEIEAEIAAMLEDDEDDNK
ncbi:tetratricopeptide repeat protein [Dysgonomonas sp. HGC4]|uniref:tetratricopeptide repeat protein n=1 Tax=Dysgonomonas sp. HGC4 TaxID=1658009 RepID=UPI00068360C8|nr:tetratricopeptide repeat protein [Dysgonomonas sp. HGC4]MBD8349132.1 hypothetical protein [Dysgonomonas sp. HGC4]